MRQTKAALEQIVARADVVGSTNVGEDWHRPFRATNDQHPYVEGRFLDDIQVLELSRAGMLDPLQTRLASEGARYIPAAQVDLDYLASFAQPTQVMQEPPVFEEPAHEVSLTAPKQPKAGLFDRFSTYVAAAGVLALVGLGAWAHSYFSKPDITPKKAPAPVVAQVDTGYIDQRLVAVASSDDELTFDPIDTSAGLYTVKAGDTYESIAANQLGDRRLGFYLRQKNGREALHPNDTVDLTPGSAIVQENALPWEMAKQIAKYERRSIVNVLSEIKSLNPEVDLNDLRAGDSYKIPQVQAPMKYAANTSPLNAL